MSRWSTWRVAFPHSDHPIHYRLLGGADNSPIKYIHILTWMWKINFFGGHPKRRCQRIIEHEDSIKFSFGIRLPVTMENDETVKKMCHVVGWQLIFEYSIYANLYLCMKNKCFVDIFLYNKYTVHLDSNLTLFLSVIPYL